MARKTYWPHAILLSLVACVCACVATIAIAAKNPVQMDNLYFETIQNVDSNINEILASQKAFESKFRVDFLGKSGSRLEISVRDLSGRDVRPNFKLLLTRPDTNERNLTLQANYEGEILRTQEIVFPLAGRWQLMAKFSDANSSGFYKFEFYVGDE